MGRLHPQPLQHAALGLAACNQQSSAGNGADMALANADNGAGDMMTNGEEAAADAELGGANRLRCRKCHRLGLKCRALLKFHPWRIKND